MKIKRVVCAEGLGGFFFDDQAAIKQGAPADGFTYRGSPVTPGYTAIRMPARAVSVMLQLDDGAIAHGDCVWTQYAGISGRDPLLPGREIIGIIQEQVAPVLEGRELAGFKPVCKEVDGLEHEGRRLQSAIRYGVTQALLDAVARAKRKTMAGVLAEEYGLELATEPIPLWAQCGDDWYDTVDKMILRRVAVLPEPLVNTRERLDRMLDHMRWLSRRIRQLAGEDYRPTFFYLVCGTIGEACGHDINRMVDYFGEIEKASAPYPVLIEDPVVMDSKAGQVEAMRELRRALRAAGSSVRLIADEWAISLDDKKEFILNGATDVSGAHHPNDLGGINNTIEAIGFCRDHGLEAVLGGTCCETERCAQVRAHIALAARPACIIAAPGMGVDESVSIVTNEMRRTLALLSIK
ncbi:MAG: methylaspartate ammonia-lyase [Chloroflexi bacterium]|nr:methylaspartate ammonia-lyase [Chloroflexota bacterium]